MDSGVEFRVIEYGSADYNQTVALRQKMLRELLGLTFTQADLELDRNDIHISGFINGTAVSCMLLVPLPQNVYKLRQVCVEESLSRRGIGTKMVFYAHDLLRQKGCRLIVLNARKLSIDFYKRLGYHIVSDEFVEVGIPHFKMELALDS